MDVSKSTVFIGVLTKNSGRFIDGVLRNVEAYASLFKSYRCLIVDGASLDNTKQKCEFWCSKNAEKRKFVQQDSKKQRGESLVEARNFVLETFGKHTANYLLLLDGDSVNSKPVDLEGFKTCFQTDGWAAMFANQPTCYYDIWALRSEECPDDYQIPVHLGKETWASVGERVKNLQTRKDPSKGLIEVTSAFGGAGIYNASKLNLLTDRYQCWQKVYNEERGSTMVLPVCEHVPFHSEMKRRGCKLYINCRWLISDHE